jgi:uroporphyrinogen-III decarboxylase
MNNYERFERTVNWKPVDRILTYDFVDNRALLLKYGGYDESKDYSFEEIVEVNARTFKKIRLDVTRYTYDPANHWMGLKIVNWIRFFGVNPDKWEVSQKGGTAWISKRPFSNLRELERNMPQVPKYEDVKEWYEPFIKHVKEVFDYYGLVFIGAVEGPITDTYTYTDMELFCTIMYDAPELLSHIMDCTGKFSSYVARVFAENASAPLQFMGEDIAGSTGALFSPKFIREQGLSRWRWIMDPVKKKGYKFLFHTDGKYGELLHIIFDELGADGLNPIERNGCNDIFEIRKMYPQKLLFGNVCCEVTLPHGNIYDVEDETLEIIEKVGPEGGILIGSSSEVHDLVPPDNAMTMYDTVHEYGTYPIDVDRIRRRRAAIKDRLTTRKEETDNR